ncbi:MlaA family lipoprotein [Paraburkholderia diazotrophica]|uniref:Phospholipid-binding lipoprotein MlaA n=1 Tax=Paraburkholderia diazotrophica TaxID=667676 RepID=A0A1H6S7R1_9BURK|nr:VacJ family lipoprotein [Paraburkholderia diazotrophica]SEI63961.1 phospholipid-binding lipoprotein MlaA [Paraburkholderia diazotrophica]
MKMRTAALALAAASFATGCATGPDRKPGDPLEPMNRAIFTFNDALDRTVAVPIAKGYQKVTPQPLRQAISNFFSNLGDLDNFANSLLQLHIKDATESLMRFAMNSTFGIGGLIDFATPAGLPKHKQDFGLTLGRWGVPSGPYLVLPLFGPSSFRDGLGYFVDFRANPMTYLDAEYKYPLYFLQFVSVRSDLLGATTLLEQAALDKYSFVRDAYTQQRRSLLRSAGAPASNLPNYSEPEDSGAEAPSGASGVAPSTVPGAAPAGLPNYEEPGAAPPEGASGAGGAKRTPPANDDGLPNYEDPGDTSAPAPASTTAPTGGTPAPSMSNPSGAAPGQGAAPPAKQPDASPSPSPSPSPDKSPSQ